MSRPPSSGNPAALRSIQALRRLTQAIALLDAIICPEWQFRYYSFNSKWNLGEEMASMRDGGGNGWFLLFSEVGAALKGFAHESALANDPAFPGRVQQAVPACFASFLREPAFSMSDVTFCLWRRATDEHWSVVTPATGAVSAEADGSAELLEILDGRPHTYHAWAEAYFERALPLAAIEQIYAHQPLTQNLVTALNSDISLSDITAAVAEIGYPVV